MASTDMTNLRCGLRARRPPEHEAPEAPLGREAAQRTYGQARDLAEDGAAIVQRQMESNPWNEEARRERREGSRRPQELSAP